jgi:hypothetical protein
MHVKKAQSHERYISAVSRSRLPEKVKNRLLSDRTSIAMTASNYALDSGEVPYHAPDGDEEGAHDAPWFFLHDHFGPDSDRSSRITSDPLFADQRHGFRPGDRIRADRDSAALAARVIAEARRRKAAARGAARRA